MRVFLIRHGHAEHNEGFQKYGVKAYSDVAYRDSSLTELGHKQTTEAGAYLEVSVERVYCSPLRRCIQTARNIFGFERCLYLNDGLSETRGPYPCNDRLEFDEICAQFKNINVSAVSVENINTLEKEDDAALKLRVNACYTAICENAKRAGLDRIAIVTHHDWLEALTGVRFKNAEIIEVSAPSSSSSS